MEVGDIVMFVDSGRYAKWFYGKLGEVTSYTAVAKSDGQAHCAVRWIQPVEYSGRWTSKSHFKASCFEVYQE
jgi:hypothetical protein